MSAGLQTEWRRWRSWRRWRRCRRVSVCVCSVHMSITDQTGRVKSVELAMVMKMGCKVQLRDVVISE